MDLDELLALMAAPIYAARWNVAAHSCTHEEWDDLRNAAMQLAVKEARMIWNTARAEALRRGRTSP